MSNRFTRLFTEPLIQFLLLGALIYGAYALFGPPDESYRDNRIMVDADRINGLITEWERRWNRPPTRKEVDGLLQAYIKEEVLFRQAVAMGLNRDDPVTRRRMAQKLEFLTSDLARMQQPDEGELKRYFEANELAYREPDRISFTHIYLNPKGRGQSTLSDADNILAQLQAAGPPGETTLEAGDRFMLQNHFVAATELAISRQLGSGFAEVVMGLEPGRWHGPVLSGYGVHLVYVHESEQAPPALFEDVQARVLEDWHAEQREQFNTEFLESLKSRFEIVVDEVPTERLLAEPVSENDEAGSR
ncbi:MAG: peptidyl-prolyl cis-trans isomerase [Xanthomonadales bacterium]|nr:peptidyl-prolyl cis-trans isomerase [Gammaproteobacteria bacterium]MBT8053120.1 peptidyl-prolyl cis-trans isomerase [Gammaproteobacteria bacterium]NNK52303.1 peptidyl-prolyl cis-trans isomerase [Xanthomonadales bacterium]